MLNNIPLLTKITVWICIAHCWIIICTIVYVKLEGLPQQQRNDNNNATATTTTTTLPVTESELVSRILSDFSGFKTSPRERLLEFQKEYERRWKENKKLVVRKHFNDVPKTYVFVLLSHAGIGSHSDMTLQRWQTQLFYILTMPLGFVFYYMMIHQITVEIFELDAYVAVTIICHKAQTSAVAWTIDRRELYEKFKVFLIALLRLVTAVYLLALLALLSGKSYIEGVYSTLNMIFLVTSSQPELFPYGQVHSHGTVAFIMTVLVFTVVLLFYTALYSLIILFRYNNLGELCDLIFSTDYDPLNDVIHDDDDDDLLMNTENYRRTWDGGAAMVKTKTTTQQLPINNDDFWWEKEPPRYGLYRPHSPRQNTNELFETGEAVGSGGGTGGYYKKVFYSPSSSSSSMSSDEEYDELEQRQRRMRIQQQQQQQQQQQKKKQNRPSLKLKMAAVGKMPSIEVTTPTPSPTEEVATKTSPTDDFFTFAHAAHKKRVKNATPRMPLQD